MKQYATAFAVAVLCLSVLSSFAGGTRTVPGTATGKYYNDVSKSWSKQPISIYVDGDASIYFKGGESLLKAVGYIDKSDFKTVVDLLKKSLEWSKKAKANQLEVTKELGTFFREYNYSEQGIGLEFFSASKGQQTDVILEIKDFSSGITSIKLYVEPEEVKKLIAILEKAPETYKKLKKQMEKSKVLE